MVRVDNKSLYYCSKKLWDKCFIFSGFKMCLRSQKFYTNIHLHLSFLKSPVASTTAAWNPWSSFLHSQIHLYLISVNQSWANIKRVRRWWWNGLHLTWLLTSVFCEECEDKYSMLSCRSCWVGWINLCFYICIKKPFLFMIQSLCQRTWELTVGTSFFHTYLSKWNCRGSCKCGQHFRIINV